MDYSSQQLQSESSRGVLKHWSTRTTGKERIFLGHEKGKEEEGLELELVGPVPCIIGNQLLGWQSRGTSRASGTMKTKPPRLGTVITSMAGLGGLVAAVLADHLMALPEGSGTDPL
ncbi:hypothetical protein MHYP_G00243070 [Metynnis hypsauchen]